MALGQLGALMGGGGAALVGGSTVRLLLDDAQFNSGLTRAQGRLNQSQTQMGQSTSRWAGAQKAAYLGVGLIVAKFAVDAVQELFALDKANLQTAAGIKSTGGVANVTAAHVRDLSSRLEEMSSVDEIAIQNSENLMLTFTNVRNEGEGMNAVFDRSIEAALNLSVRFGKDLASSAVTVGRALNDPIRGLTLLGKAGVDFTAQQREQIKTLVESGRLLEAQKIILAELHDEVGGAAKALGDSAEGQWALFTDQITDTTRELLAGVVPAFSAVTKGLRFAAPVLDEVLMAFLAYKAIQFLPGVLIRVSQGMAAVGTGAAGARIQGAGMAFSNVASKIGMVAAAAVLAAPLIEDMFRSITDADIEDAAAELSVAADKVKMFREALGGESTATVSLWDKLFGDPDKAQADAIKAAEGLAQVRDSFIDLGHTGEEWTTKLDANWGRLMTILRTEGVKAFTAELREMFGVTAGGAQSADIAAEAYDSMGKTIAANAGDLETFAAITGQSMDQVREAILSAARESPKALEEMTDEMIAKVGEWKTNLATQFNGVAESLQELAGKTNVSADQIIQSFEDQLEAMARYREDWNTVAQRGGDAADALLAHIQGMGLEGAGILAGLADSNDREFNEILRLWSRGGKEAGTLADQIVGILLPAFQEIINAIREGSGLKPINFELRADAAQARKELDEYLRKLEGAGFVAEMHQKEKGRLHGGGPVPGAIKIGPGLLKPNEIGAVLEYDEHVVRKERARPWRSVLEWINSDPAAAAPGPSVARELLKAAGLERWEYHVGGSVSGSPDLQGAASALSKAGGQRGVFVDIIEGADLSRLVSRDPVKAIVQLGRMMQSMGYSVGEHPAFGGVAPVHVPGSYHYKRRAVDVNWYPASQERPRLFDLYEWVTGRVSPTELFFNGQGIPSAIGGHDDHLHLAMHQGGVAGHHKDKFKPPVVGASSDPAVELQLLVDAFERWAEVVGVGTDDVGGAARSFLDRLWQYPAQLVPGVATQMGTWATGLPKEVGWRYELAALADWITSTGWPTVAAELINNERAIQAAGEPPIKKKPPKPKSEDKDKDKLPERIAKLIDRERWPRTDEAVKDAITIARYLLDKRGWDEFWNDFYQLGTHESGFRWWADNPTSSAYGIGQALPGSKMASVGGDWLTNIWTQLKWMLGYVDERYDNPEKAWDFWRSHGWYHGGGQVPVIPAAMGFHDTLARDTMLYAHAGERVDISPPSGRRDGRTVHVTLNLYGDVGDEAAFARKVVKALDSEVARMGG